MISGTLAGNVPGRRAGFKPGNLPHLKKVILGLDLAGDSLTTHTVADSDLVGDANHIYFPADSIGIFSSDAVGGSIGYNVQLNGSDLLSTNRTISAEGFDTKTPDQNTPQTAKSHKLDLVITDASATGGDTLSIVAWPRIE